MRDRRRAAGHVYRAVTTRPQHDAVEPLAAGATPPAGAAAAPSGAKVAAPGGAAAAPPVLRRRAPSARRRAGAAAMADGAAPCRPIARCGRISVIKGLGTGGGRGVDEPPVPADSLDVRPGPGQGAVQSATRAGGGGLA